MIMHITLLLYFINSSEFWDLEKGKNFNLFLLYYWVNMVKAGTMEKVLVHWS